MIDHKPATAIVQQADETERQLVERAIASLSSSNWDVGECASRWTVKFSNGRSDEQFGNLIGLSRSQVQLCRQVYETFGDVRDEYPSLKFNHFYVARGWDNSEECLAWAEENRASIAEMKAWRRMNGGEVDDENDHFATAIPDDACQNLADEERPESTDVKSGRNEPTDQESLHVGEADPYQKPPSTVVSTPRDFPDDPEPAAVPVDPLCHEMRDIVTALRTATKLLRGGAERRAMVAELRRLADEIEGAA